MASGTPKTDRTASTKPKRLSVYSLARQRVNVPLAQKRTDIEEVKAAQAASMSTF